ncbi:MAG: CBASS cGAMP-activated phospholipase [Chloroflexota bacterium]
MAETTDTGGRGAPESTAVRRILSIDGGGIKGVFPASFLATVEDSIGGPVADYFDLIVGTSTGGIIALGLGLGFTAKEILGFYEQKGLQVFRRRRFSYLRSLIWPSYDAAPLRAALEEQFGDRRLGDSRSRLVIPSLVMETGDVYIYRTAHHPRFERDHKVRAVDVALATTAAPSFFPAHRSATGVPLVDGGVWANNPTGLAVVEAIGTLGWSAESLRVLSLGCTTAPLSTSQNGFTFGRAGWAFRLADFFMASQSCASMGTAFVLMGGHDHVRRVSPAVAKDRFSLDKVSEIATLRGLGEVEARKELPFLRQWFLQSPAEGFTPYHRIEDRAADSATNNSVLAMLRQQRAAAWAGAGGN